MESTEGFVKYQLGLPHMHHLIAVLCVVAVVYKLTVLLAQRRAVMQSMELFPGPPSHWLFGHLMEFKQDGSDLKKMVKWGQQYPYAFQMWFGPFVCFLSIRHTDYVKTILTSTEPKDTVAYTFVKPWIGDGLLVSGGQKWFRHRRLLNPGFHFEVLKPYINLMSDSVKTMLAR
ncbi:cytochrome P450 4B1-like [Trematomus bernacchii]|uniref:cytochrome P450 4B1-like n=1 Tax=Trematomus bernacchii TaxID=40690 RepID=UPI00146D778D|nr:cytochrome P450 4B1-like [Trematomus bernacchii]